jgi:ABC-type multidrug transport system ATPase subunit
MLQIENLSKRYPGGVQALDGLSLALAPGAYGLLGPNGAGKSTMMSLLATLQRPDTGTLALDGVDIAREPARLREHLGYMPQEFGFDARLRVLDLMNLMAALKQVDDCRAHVERRLTDVGLWPLRERRIGTLSGGMKQRLGLAQALLGRPRLLLLDEPTAGLDPEQREHVLNVLADASADAIVIVSTHIADDIRRLCRQVGILVRGTLRFTGPVQTLLDRLRGVLWEARAGGMAAVPPPGILRTHLDAGVRHIRVVASSRPGPEFQPVEPTLEDAYYHEMPGPMRAAG